MRWCIENSQLAFPTWWSPRTWPRSGCHTVRPINVTLIRLYIGILCSFLYFPHCPACECHQPELWQKPHTPGCGRSPSWLRGFENGLVRGGWLDSTECRAGTAAGGEGAVGRAANLAESRKNLSSTSAWQSPESFSHCLQTANLTEPRKTHQSGWYGLHAGEGLSFARYFNLASPTADHVCCLFSEISSKIPPSNSF